MKEIYSAFIKAQAEIKGATKDSENPHFKSKYADIESVIEAIKTPLANHNLAFIQPIFTENGNWYMNTILIHETGQQIESGKVELIIKDKNNPQSLKSSVTYFRRTCLLSMCGIPDIDDDGNAAAGYNQPKPKIQQQPKLIEKLVEKPIEKANNLAPCSEAQLLDLRNKVELLGGKGQILKDILKNVWNTEVKSNSDVKMYQYEMMLSWITKSKNVDDLSRFVGAYLERGSYDNK